MAILDEVVFQRSLEASKRRLAKARARRKLQVRRFKLLCIAGLTLLFVAFMVSLARRAAPAPPLLIVDWSQPLASQVFASGSTLLLRPDGPISVTVAPDPDKWSLNWTTDNDQNTGAEMQWSSSKSKDTLKLRCRARASGLTRLIAWLWPTHELVLHGIRAESLDQFRRRVTPPPGGAWVFPHILAGSPVSWDERALPLLLQATPVETQPRSLKPEASWWSLRPSFDTSVDSDGSTYALLSTFKFDDDFDAVRDLTAVARSLARAEPDASIKFVVRLDSTPAQGIIRLAFDGKAERAAWVKRPGEAVGGPLEWEQEELVGEPLDPVLPGSVRR